MATAETPEFEAVGAAPRPSRTRMRLTLCLGILGISSASLLIRLLGQREVPALTVASYRMLFACVFLAPLGMTGSTSLTETLRRHPWALLGTSFCLAAHFASFTASLYLIPVARSVLLVNSQPIFVVLLGWWLLGDRPTRAVLGCVAVSLVGVTLMSIGGGSGGASLRGDILALLGALFFAGYLLLGQRLRREVSASRYAALVYGMTGAELLIAALVTKAPVVGFDGVTWLLFVGLAVLPTLAGHTVFNWALAHVPATTVSIAFLGESAGAALLAAIFLHEIPDSWTLGGGLVCLLGVAGVVLQPMRRST